MRVLVADDSAVMRQALTGLLRSQGHEVEQAADGAEAIALLLAHLPDVVLLDLSMPRVTGWVVCRLMKEDPALCRIPVLVLTALSGPEDRFWAEQSGADGFLAKDHIDGPALLERINAVVAGRALWELTGPPEGPGPGADADVLAMVCKVLDRKLFEATVVNEITAIALRSLDLRESLGAVLAAVGLAVSYDVAALALVSERTVVLRSSRPETAASLEAFVAGVAGALGDLSGTDLNAQDLTVCHTGPGGTATADEGPARTWGSWHVALLQARGRVIGALVLAAEAAERFNERVQRTLRVMTPAVALVVKGAREFQRAIAEEVGAGTSSL